LPANTSFRWFTFYYFGGSKSWSGSALTAETQRLRFSRKQARDIHDLNALFTAWPEVVPTLTRLLQLYEKQTLPLTPLREYLQQCQTLDLIGDLALADRLLDGMTIQEPPPAAPRNELMALPPEQRGDAVRLLKIYWFLGQCRDTNQQRHLLRNPSTWFDRLAEPPLQT